MKPSNLTFPVAVVALVLCGLITSRAAFAQSMFVRGDANSDARVDVADPLATLSHLFLRGDIACRDAADSNDDGALNISDPVHTLEFLFLGGSPIPAPGPHRCGSDPTVDDLGECGSNACGDGLGEGVVPPFQIPGSDPEAVRELFQTGLFEEALDAVGLELLTSDQMVTIAQSVVSGHLSPLGSALLGLQATLTRVDRLTAGAGFEFSASYGGYGGGTEGGGDWKDTGDPAVTVMDAATALGTIFDATWIDEMIGEIVARVEEEAP